MNVFILNTGRCGSVTLAAACQHLTNFTAGHETRAALLGDDRLAFPDQHIEADNRLSWVLGKLDQTYGDTAAYIHLVRDPQAVAASFAKRYNTGVIRAYEKGILMRGSKPRKPIDVCMDYVQTVNQNIKLFLKDKTKKMRFELEEGERDFIQMCDLIGAEGDLKACLADLRKKHNASEPTWRKQIRRITGT